MDFPTVQAQLNDLPDTYRRPDAGYQTWLDAMTLALAGYTGTNDAIGQQIHLASAIDGWMDCWGLLFGVPRKQDEATPTYYARLLATMQAWMCTLPALQVWVNLYAPGGSVTENLSGLGYVIVVPSWMTTAQIQAFVASLGRIRPAGVPFIVQQVTDGMFLQTVNFVGEGEMPGSYLTSDATTIAVAISAVTNNALPLLPDIYFTDPLINGG